MVPPEWLERLRAALPRPYLLSLETVIVYGSRAQEADIDVWAILRDELPPRPITAGNIDAFVTGRKTFEEQCGAYEPMATEPLITGEVVLGPVHELELLKAKVRAATPDESVSPRLLLQSQEQLRNGCRYLEMSLTGSQQLTELALTALTFSCSYHHFARAYFRPATPGPVTLGDLLQSRAPVLKQALEQLKLAHRGQINRGEVQRLFDQWLRWLLRAGE